MQELSLIWQNLTILKTNDCLNYGSVVDGWRGSGLPLLSGLLSTIAVVDTSRSFIVLNIGSALTSFCTNIRNTLTVLRQARCQPTASSIHLECIKDALWRSIFDGFGVDRQKQFRPSTTHTKLHAFTVDPLLSGVLSRNYRRRKYIGFFLQNNHQQPSLTINHQ